MYEVITVDELSNYIEEGMLIEWKNKQYCIYSDWYVTPGAFIVTDVNGNEIVSIKSEYDLLVLEKDTEILRILEVVNC